MELRPSEDLDHMENDCTVFRELHNFILTLERLIQLDQQIITEVNWKKSAVEKLKLEIYSEVEHVKIRYISRNLVSFWWHEADSFQRTSISCPAWLILSLTHPWEVERSPTMQSRDGPPIIALTVISKVVGSIIEVMWPHELHDGLPILPVTSSHTPNLFE